MSLSRRSIYAFTLVELLLVMAVTVIDMDLHFGDKSADFGLGSGNVINPGQEPLVD